MDELKNVAMPTDWEAMRGVVEAGVMNLYEASKRFGVAFDTAKKQAKRKGWVTPARIQAKMNELKACPPKLSPSMEKGGKIVQIAAETLVDHQKEHTATVRRIMAKVWRATEKAPPAIETMADMEKADKITRLNEGMNTGEAQAQVQLLFSSSHDLGSMQDATPVTQDVDTEVVGEWDEEE